MIMDMLLPDGKGTELLKQLQSRPVKPLVVMISGMGTVELAVECMSNGAFTFLTKPFSTEQLAVTLKKAEEHTQLVKVNQLRVLFGLFERHRSEEHTSELQSHSDLVCRLLLEKK